MDPLEKEVEAFIGRFDKDHDSVLTAKELKEGVKGLSIPLTKQQRHKLLDIIDKDHDGSISRDEVAAFLRSRNQELEGLFTQFDKDKSGFIDREELSAILQSLGYSFDQETVSRMMNKVDTNHDDKISFNEWKDFLLLVPDTNLSDIFGYWEDGLSIPDEEGIITQPPAQKGASFLSSFGAGAVAGALSRTATAPLERLKIIYQVHTVQPTSMIEGLKTLHKEGGIRGLFRGNLANILKVSPQSAIKFATFDLLKNWIQIPNPDGSTNKSASRFVAGGMAGVAAHATMYPVEVIKTRLSIAPAEVYKGIWDCGAKMFKTEGFLAFYKGITPALLSTIPHAGLNLMVYESFKLALMAKYGKEEPTVAMLMVCSTVSSTTGQLVAYPMHVFKARLMAQGTPGLVAAGQYSGLMDVIRKTYHGEGIRGFYRGIVPTFVKSVPANWITYITYEAGKKYFHLEKKKHHD